MSKTLKAGAIILSATNKDKIALLYRGKQKDWSFPKGHIEQGEDPIQAMEREMNEETGLNVKVIRTLPDIEYISSSGEDSRVKMFLVVSVDDSKLKLEHENDKVEWISLNKVVERLSHYNLKEYFKSILQSIK